MSDEEKGAFWDILVSASADIPEIFKDITEFGGKASALIGTGVAAVHFFRKRHEYKKFYQRFESIGRGLIPIGVSEEDTKQIFSIVIDYLRKLRHSDHKLSYYFLNKERAPELVEQIFQACILSGKDLRISNDDLRISLRNLAFVLLQNSGDVMILTETADVVEDILRRLEKFGINLNSIVDRINTLEEIVHQLPPDYITYVNNAVLPSEISSNIFSFRNPAISYQNSTNLDKLREWLYRSSIPVWAVTGPGGSGKSRLALELAKEAERKAICKPVWLDKYMMQALLDCSNYNYSKPVLFICDYASQFEEQLVSLIDKISSQSGEAKFLLLERSAKWYYGIRTRNSIIETHSTKKPIDLSDTTFSDDELSQIITELAVHEYKGQSISFHDKQQIIKKQRNYLVRKTLFVFLFFMLVTYSYFKDSDIRNLNPEALLNNYILHSRMIVLKNLGWNPNMDQKQKRY